MIDIFDTINTPSMTALTPWSDERQVWEDVSEQSRGPFVLGWAEKLT